MPGNRGATWRDVTSMFHPHVVEDVRLTDAGERIFGASLDMHALLQELLTTPDGPTGLDEGGGNTVNVINGTGRTRLPAATGGSSRPIHKQR